jgi:hypothetical protein
MSPLSDWRMTDRLSRGGENKMCWIPSKRQRFEVRYFYNALSPLLAPFPWNSIWRNKVPMRVKEVLCLVYRVRKDIDFG